MGPILPRCQQTPPLTKPLSVPPWHLVTHSLSLLFLHNVCDSFACFLGWKLEEILGVSLSYYTNPSFLWNAHCFPFPYPSWTWQCFMISVLAALVSLSLVVSHLITLSFSAPCTALRANSSPSLSGGLSYLRSISHICTVPCWLPHSVPWSFLWFRCSSQLPKPVTAHSIPKWVTPASIRGSDTAGWVGRLQKALWEQAFHILSFS